MSSLAHVGVLLELFESSPQPRNIVSPISCEPGQTDSLSHTLGIVPSLHRWSFTYLFQPGFASSSPLIVSSHRLFSSSPFIVSSHLRFFFIFIMDSSLLRIFFIIGSVGLVLIMGSVGLVLI